MCLSEDIKSISAVKGNTGKVLEHVNASGPMVIAQHGKAAVVLMGVKDDETIHNTLDLLNILTMSKKTLRKFGFSQPNRRLNRVNFCMEEEYSGLSFRRKLKQEFSRIIIPGQRR